MLGGGTFVTQNKVLPGTYHNFISARRSFLNLSERGFVAVPLELSWGADGVTVVTAEDFETRTLEVLGYKYDSEEMKPLREIFKKAHTVYLSPLKGSGAVKAANTFAEAKHSGTRGNSLKTVVLSNVDTPTLFDVQTVLDNVVVDEQKAVATMADLVDNAFVNFKADATLALNAGLNLTGGVNGTVDVTTHQKALEDFEAYSFNTLIIDSALPNVKNLYIAYTKRMRNDVGAKFQLVVHNAVTPDSEGIINVFNEAVEGPTKLVYWVGGASAGVNVNASNENAVYDGEYTVKLDGAKTHNQLIEKIKGGFYVLHKVDNQTRVLADINSFTSFTTDKNQDFALNQVIRVLDQIAIDTANIFNTRYLGKVPNDNDGRISLWGDLVAHRMELQNIRALQNYDSKALTVKPGVEKNAVVANEVIETAVAMSKLYITTVVA